MPAIMTLQGPNLALLGGGVGFPLVESSPLVAPAVSSGSMFAGLSGPVFDTVKAHPWVLLLGLVVGGYAASRVLPEWGGAWGSHYAAHKRETSFHGPRRRRRR
jgi:hypothetical protein